MEILNEVLTVDRFCRKPCCEFDLLNFTDEIFLSKIYYTFIYTYIFVLDLCTLSNIFRDFHNDEP